MELFLEILTEYIQTARNKAVLTLQDYTLLLKGIQDFDINDLCIQ